MSLWTSLKELILPARIAARQELRDFLESRSAYLVQKSIMEYSQARAPMMFSTLLSEQGFLAAYERARWLAYPAALSMVAEALEGALRPLAGDRAGLVQGALVALGREIFASFPTPGDADPGFWARAGEALGHDIARAGLAQPKPTAAIVLPRAREIFDVLPAHESLRAYDFPVFRNTLKLHLAEIREEFEERVDRTPLTHDMLDKS